METTGYVTSESVDKLIKAYEEQVTALKNENESLKASQSVETQTEERNQEAGADHHVEMMKIFRNANITNK